MTREEGGLTSFCSAMKLSSSGGLSVLPSMTQAMLASTQPIEKVTKLREGRGVSD